MITTPTGSANRIPAKRATARTTSRNRAPTSTAGTWSRAAVNATTARANATKLTTTARATSAHSLRRYHADHEVTVRRTLRAPSLALNGAPAGAPTMRRASHRIGPRTTTRPVVRRVAEAGGPSRRLRVFR